MATTHRSESFSGITTPIDVVVRTASTDVTLVEGEPGGIDVELTAHASDVDLHAAEIRFDNGRLVIVVPPLQSPSGPSGLALQFGSRTFTIGGGGMRSELEIRLPAGNRVNVETKSGEVRVEAPCDELQVESASGDVTVEKAATAKVQTASGDVTVDSAGELVVTTGSGDVRVETAGSARLKTASGDIGVDSVEGSLQAHTASGDIDVDAVGGEVTVRTASGDATVGGIRRGKVNATTVSGDLNLSFVHGVPVWTDATTVSGDISNELSSRGEPQDGQPFVEVVARTVSGDLTLSDD